MAWEFPELPFSWMPVVDFGPPTVMHGEAILANVVRHTASSFFDFGRYEPKLFMSKSRFIIHPMASVRNLTESAM